MKLSSTIFYFFIGFFVFNTALGFADDRMAKVVTRDGA